MKHVGVLVALAAATWVGGCGTESSGLQGSRRDCTKLRDHMVELRMDSVTVDREQHRAAVTASLGDGFVRRCVEQIVDGQMSSKQLQCGLAATDSEALGACRSQP